MESLNTNQFHQWRNACRLCFLEDGIKLPIFEEEGKQRRVSHKIQSCFPIVIYETDPLPKMICHKCLFKLETVFEFRQKCMDVNTSLLSHLEPHGNDIDVQKYWAAMRENFTSQDSYYQVQGEKRRETKVHSISLSDIATSDVSKKARCLIKPTLPKKQDGTVPAALNYPERMVLNQPTIGAHGARVTRSGNVSGGAVDSDDAINVFQEVFLDEVSSDGFFPEQQSGDGAPQLQDMLAPDADSVAQKRKEGVDEPAPILKAKMIKKEFVAVEENLSLQFQTAKTAMQPVLQVNPLPGVDSGSQNSNVPVAKPIGIKKFVCKTCDFKSSDRLEMREHLCAFQMSYTCELCSKYFYDKATFAKHRSQGDCVLSFKRCPQCKASFKSLEALAEHQTVHFKVIACTKEEDLHPCDCGMRFVCELMLASHRETHKVTSGEPLQVCAGENEFKCAVCAKSFFNPDHFRNHMLVHNFSTNLHRKGVASNKGLSSEVSGTRKKKSGFSASSFKCEYCLRVFKQLSPYLNHVKIHKRPQGGKSHDESNISRQLLSMDGSTWAGRKCKQCNVVLNSMSAYLIHRRQHVATSKVKKLKTCEGVKNVNGIVSCNVCGKVFTTDAELEAHLQVHSEGPAARPIIGIFQCSACGKSFSSKEAKLQHQKIHDVGGSKSFDCKVCHKKFLSEDACVSHMKVHNQVSCNTCSKTFENQDALKIHVCNSETSPQIKCPLCPGLFLSMNARNSHMKVHKTCTNTSDVGSTRSAVSEVLQRLDTNPSSKNPVPCKTKDGYKCNICDKRTITLQGCRQHIRWHSFTGMPQQKSERNFKCPFCSRGFASLNATYDHITVNHPDASVH